MIKRERLSLLRSMACILGKALPGLCHNNNNKEPIFINLSRKLSTKVSHTNNIGFSLRGCGGGGEVTDLRGRGRRESGVNGDGGGGFIVGLQQEEKRCGVVVNGNGNGSSSNGGVLMGGCGFSGGGSSFPEKVSVAVDVDEVLGNFVSALNRFIADRYKSNHSVSEYYVYEFFKIWNCSREEADVRVHEFFKSTYFKNGIHPIPGAQRAVQKLAGFCNLSIVTSRQNVIKDHTIEWIEKHFPGLFEEMHFGNHFALDGVSRPKSEICRSVGAKVLIDDNPRYALECAEVGIRVLLFDYQNSYPWCKTGSSHQHPLVTKVHNWEEVEQQLASWIYSSHL